MANRMTEEARPYEQKRSNFQKKVNFVDCSDSSDSDEDQMVGSAEWVQNNKKPISCPFGNKELKNMVLILPRLTRSSICYCQRGRSS